MSAVVFPDYKIFIDAASDLGKLVVIGHADNPLGAIALRDQVQERFPDAEIHVADIGAVIGAHVGPRHAGADLLGNNKSHVIKPVIPANRVKCSAFPVFRS